MVTIPGLKVNKFVETTIPSGKELFARFGFTKKEGSYSGDKNLLDNKSKVEKIAAVEKEILEKE